MDGGGSVAAVVPAAIAELTLGARVPEITGVNETVSLGGAPADVLGDVQALSARAVMTTPATSIVCDRRERGGQVM